jgi:carbonic anhydrase
MTDDPHNKSYQDLFEGNERFIEERLSEDPDYFKKLEKGQKPHVLWIGCADSRVPANVITGQVPGEVFVHRNIANVAINTDINMLSVLQYAVEVLEVPHVIVCGHYGCGGVAAALSDQSFGLIDTWLSNIKDVYRFHASELAELDDHAKNRRLVELNVIESVHNLCETSIIQGAWKKRKSPHVHGWVYDLGNGKIQDLNVSRNDVSSIDDIYRYKLP